MEFLYYRAIKTKQNRRGILFKKPNPEEISAQFYTLARELDDFKQYSAICYLAANPGKESGRNRQVSVYLNAARSLSKLDHEILSIEDHIQTVNWAYKEALAICDPVLMAPIYNELGLFLETHRMHVEAAHCFKQSKSISRCVSNLLQSKRYQVALEELKNQPSHLLSHKDQTTMFLLNLLLDDAQDLDKTDDSGLAVSTRSDVIDLKPTSSKFNVDDYHSDLRELLDSLWLVYREERWSQVENKQRGNEISRNAKTKKIIIDRLSAFLDQAQTQLLYVLYEKGNFIKT